MRMSKLIADLFVEDRAHEALLKPLIVRIAREEGIEVAVHVRSARGGHGRAIAEFKAYQQVVEKGIFGDVLPDLLVVGIDGNCSTFTKKREEIEAATDAKFQDRLIAACPDPHIERWYLADPESFKTVVGVLPVVGGNKCARDYYKQLLSQAIRDAGYQPTLGGIEFAPNIAQCMDFYRAGKNDHSIKAFVDDLRGKLRSISGGRRT